MTIRVYTPEDIRDMPKPVTLWAVWEGTDGKHHEEAKTYQDSRFYKAGDLTYVVYDKHPLVLDDYDEDPGDVLPDTLRFVCIEDLVKLDRITDVEGRTYTLHPYAYTSEAGHTLISVTLNNLPIHIHGNYTRIKAKVDYEA